MKDKKKILQMLCPYFLLGCGEHDENVEVNKMAYLMDNFAQKDEEYKILQNAKEKEEATYDTLVEIFKSVQKEFELVSQEYQIQSGIKASLYKENEKDENNEYVLENEYENSHDINNYLSQQNSIYSNESKDAANLNYARQRLQDLNNDKDDLRDKNASMLSKIASFKGDIKNIDIDTNTIKVNRENLKNIIAAMKVDISKKKDEMKNHLAAVINNLKKDYNELIDKILKVFDVKTIDTSSLTLDNLPCYENFGFQDKKFTTGGGGSYGGALINNEIFCKILDNVHTDDVHKEAIGQIIVDHSKKCKDEDSKDKLKNIYIVFLNDFASNNAGNDDLGTQGPGLYLYLNGQHQLKGFSKVCKYIGSYNMEVAPLYKNGDDGMLGMDGNYSNNQAKYQIKKMLNIFYTWFSKMTYIKYDHDSKMLGARYRIVYSLFKDNICKELEKLHKDICNVENNHKSLDTNEKGYLPKIQTLNTQLKSICNEKASLKSKIEKTLGKWYMLEHIKVKFHYQEGGGGGAVDTIVFSDIGGSDKFDNGIQIVDNDKIENNDKDTDIAHAMYSEYAKSYKNYLINSSITKFT